MLRFLVLAVMELTVASAQQFNYQSIFGSTVQVASSAIDPAGNIYIAGSTTSASIPVTANAFQKTFTNSVCGYIPGPHGTTGPPIPCAHGFIVKIDPSGTKLLYATYIGGELEDAVSAIAVDQAGNLYLAGRSSSKSFPVTAGAWQTALGSEVFNGFIAKLNPSGSGLVYSTYLSGAGGNAIAADEVGNVFVAGSASGSSFAATPGAYRRDRLLGHEDAFVVKLNASGSAPIYATLVGGTYTDAVTAMAIDPVGNVYIAGITASTPTFSQPADILFPVTSGAYNTGKRVDVFITKLNTTGSALLYSAVFGGSGDDNLSSLAVDAAGAAYFAGFSIYSPDFPTSPGAFRTKYGGGYVGKLSPDGARLFYSTYLGTNQSDGVSRLTVDANGRALVSGIANRADFPTTPDAEQPCFPGQATGFHSAFIAKFDESGSRLSYSTFATGVPAMDPNGMYYFTPGTTAILNRTPAAGDTKPALRCVVNGASYRQGPVAPGEIITLIGPGIGPDQALGIQLDSDGRVATSLGDVTVSIGGIAAPLLYVSKDQINAVVPFEVEGRESAPIQVRQGSVVLESSVKVEPAHPAIFTMDASGYGPAAVINQDGTINLHFSREVRRGSNGQKRCRGGYKDRANEKGAVVWRE